MSITKALRKLEYRLNAEIENFTWHHPVLGYFFTFIGMPLLVLLGVCISTIVLAFPTAWLLGWL